jgi:hypothetical protein
MEKTGTYLMSFRRAPKGRGGIGDAFHGVGLILSIRHRFLALATLELGMTFCVSPFATPAKESREYLYGTRCIGSRFPVRRSA